MADNTNVLFWALVSYCFSHSKKISPKKRILEPNVSGNTKLFVNNDYINLTKRETECVHYLAQGLSNKCIAKNLGISPRTVEIHITHVRDKVGCPTSKSLLSVISKMGGY